MFQSYQLKPKNILGTTIKKKIIITRASKIKSASGCGLIPTSSINSSILRFKIIAFWSVLFKSSSSLGSLVSLHLLVHLLED